MPVSVVIGVGQRGLILEDNRGTANNSSIALSLKDIAHKGLFPSLDAQ